MAQPEYKLNSGRQRESMHHLVPLTGMKSMQKLLRETSSNFGDAPRDFSWWSRLFYLRVSKPNWLNSDPSDKLNIHFKHLKDTFENGVVVWGHIIQANGLLFQPGPDNCPGEVVYCLEGRKKILPGDLQEVAHSLGRLKGTAPRDRELAPIANYLTDERIRVFGLPVPRTISPLHECKISSTFFVRKHLPGRRLLGPVLPLVVNCEKPHVAIPLPGKYWPEKLVDLWMGRE